MLKYANYIFKKGICIFDTKDRDVAAVSVLRLAMHKMNIVQSNMPMRLPLLSSHLY